MSHSRRFTDRPQSKTESEGQATVLQFPGRRAEDRRVVKQPEGGPDHSEATPDTRDSNESSRAEGSSEVAKTSMPERAKSSTSRSRVTARNMFSVAAVFAVPLLSLYLSQVGNMKVVESGSRSLASVEPLGSERDDVFETKLAIDLSQIQRDVAGVQMGRAPTAEEKLRYDVLQGEYRVLLKQDRLAQIESNSDSQRLISIKDGEQFLRRQMALLPSGVERIVAIEKSHSPSGISETFALMNGDRSMGHVKMDLDPQRKLRSMIVTD